MPSTGRPTTKTYLYLRVALLALAIFLGAALPIERAFGDTPWPGSISAYYYTPVQSVFVGTLVAMGLCLVAIKGRDLAREDLMLNVAGMFAPVVALVPTPLEDSDACGPSARCVPAAFVPGVENNVQALIVVGALGVLFAAHTVRAAGSSVPTCSVWRVGARHRRVGVWFVVGRGAFLDFAHYGTAMPMFGLIVAVASSTPRRSRSSSKPAAR